MIHIKYRIKFRNAYNTYYTTKNVIYPYCWVECARNRVYCSDAFSEQYICLDDIEEISVGDSVIKFGRVRTPDRINFIKRIFPYFCQLNTLMEQIEKSKEGDK